MGSVIELDEFRPHEISYETCADCGHRSVSVAPVGTPWPRECSQCPGDCYPTCEYCGGPASDILWPVLVIGLCYSGESWTELGCHCSVEWLLS